MAQFLSEELVDHSPSVIASCVSALRKDAIVTKEDFLALDCNDFVEHYLTQKHIDPMLIDLVRGVNDETHNDLASVPKFKRQTSVFSEVSLDLIVIQLQVCNY